MYTGARVVNTRLGHVAAAQRCGPTKLSSNRTSQLAILHAAEGQEQKPQQAPEQQNDGEQPEVLDEVTDDHGTDEDQEQPASGMGASALSEVLAAEADEEEQLQEFEAGPKDAEAIGRSDPAAAVVDAEEAAHQGDIQQDDVAGSELGEELDDVDEQQQQDGQGQQQDEQPEEQADEQYDVHEGQEQDGGAAAELEDADPSQEADEEDILAAGTTIGDE